MKYQEEALNFMGFLVNRCQADTQQENNCLFPIETTLLQEQKTSIVIFVQTSK